MIRTLLAATTLTATLALPAAAFDIDAMTPAERDAFRNEVRDYLLENPEVLMEAIAVLEERQAVEQVENDRALVAANADDIFGDGYSWVGGNPEGDVTLVEFMDYRCSFCRRAHPEVQDLVGFDGNIRYIVKEFPILGEESVAASRFALAVKSVAGDDVYKTVHDILITVRGTMNDETFARIAEEQGLDFEAIRAEMDSPIIAAMIQSNYELAQRLNISGTPSFIFGEEMVRGYVPLAQMQEIVAAVRDGS